MKKRHQFSHVSINFPNLYCSSSYNFGLLQLSFDFQHVLKEISLLFLSGPSLWFVLCTINYASMAIFWYLMFGLDVQSQITLNLPTNKLSSRVIIYTTPINPISKYALMFTPIINATKTWSFPYPNMHSYSLLFN